MSVVEFEPYSFDFSFLHNNNFGLFNTKLEEINYIILNYHIYTVINGLWSLLNWLKATIKQYTCIKAYYWKLHLTFQQ